MVTKRKSVKSPAVPRWIYVIAIVAVVAIMSTIVLATVVLTRQTVATQAQAVTAVSNVTTYTGTKPISAKQVSYINGLGVDTGRDIPSFVEAMFKGISLNELTTVQAGDIIDSLNAIKYSATTTPAP